MCDPVTGGMVALNAIQTMSGIDAQNQAAMENNAAANKAAADEQDETTRGFVEQQRSLIQGGFDAILEGRAAEAEAYTSAISNGVQGSSLKAVLRDQRQKSGRNQSRVGQEMKSLKTQTGANYKHIRSKAMGRTAQVSTTKMNLGDAAGILAPIGVKYQQTGS